MANWGTPIVMQAYDLDTLKHGVLISCTQDASTCVMMNIVGKDVDAVPLYWL